MLGNFDGYLNDLNAQTGKWIGMIGGDYGLDANHDFEQTNQILIDYWNQGGLVTISWHLKNPWTGGSPWDTDNNEDLSELIDPNSPMYGIWRAQLDEIADALGPLRDAGVTVLWRPLHEMNGDWFWWGEKHFEGHEQAYKDLYVDMFNYLTYEQRMDNLLWVYSVGDTYQRTLTNYYPGSEYVDVVGIDVYADDANTFDSYTDYRDLQSLGHPMGLTEFGPRISSANGDYDYRRLISAIKSKYHDFVFSYSWHDFNLRGDRVHIAYANNLFAQETFDDSWVITRDEIDLEANPLPTGVTELTGETRIKNLWSDKYLHQTANRLDASVRMFPLRENWPSQRWNIETGVAGAYRLRCSWGNLFLNSTGNRNGSPVEVYSLNNRWAVQLWHIESVGGDTVRFKNRRTGTYLETPNTYKTQTNELDVNSFGQLWVLEYLDGRDVRLPQGEPVELQFASSGDQGMLEVTNIDSPLEYEIHDTSGSLVLMGHRESVNVSTLASGTYLLTGYLKNENGTDRFARGIFTKQ